jgi:hypothetical protein
MMPLQKGSNSKNKGCKQSAAQEQPLLQRIQNTLPTFHDKQKNASTANSGGHYAVYKEATLKFHNWISFQACPNLEMTSVNDYRNGVQRILDHNRSVYLKEEKDPIVTPPEIMISLSSSVRLREKVTAKHFGSKDGGDLGHRYIIDVLKYCRSALQFANRMAYALNDTNEGDENVPQMIGGRFDVLTLDDRDDDEEVNWEDMGRDIKEGIMPIYSGIEVEETFDIHDTLLKGDDRFQAAVFLHTMDDLMGTIQQQYGILKSYMRGNCSTQPSSSCIQLLMECTVVTNVAIDSVNRAENELSIEHPHLSSFYHVLALVFMTDFIAEINKLIDKTRLRKNPHMSLQFVAELIECPFHNQNGHERMPSIINRFVKRSGLEPRLVEEYARFIHGLTSFETLRDVEFHERNISNPSAAEKFAAAGMQPHMWFRHCQYIGGYVCILSTQRIVQMFMGIVKDNEIPVGRSGSFGPPFDEKKSLARGIRNDLDGLFASTILPEISKICKFAPIDKLPSRSYLITVLDLLHRHLKVDPTRPVPVALTFGLHAVLMSIFVLQGDGDLNCVAGCTKRSYNMVFEQFQAAADKTKSPENIPKFYEEIQKFRYLAGLAKPIPAKLDQVQALEPFETEMFAFWNPVIGGEYVLYATSLCSIGLGSATVDSIGQLKSVLHLYHALKLRDSTFDVPFLQNLDAVFSNTKGVWIGGKPEKGSCCMAFWMSRGINGKRASRLTYDYEATKDGSPVDFLFGPGDIRR